MAFLEQCVMTRGPPLRQRQYIHAWEANFCLAHPMMSFVHFAAISNPGPTHENMKTNKTTVTQSNQPTFILDTHGWTLCYRTCPFCRIFGKPCRGTPSSASLTNS